MLLVLGLQGGHKLLQYSAAPKGFSVTVVIIAFDYRLALILTRVVNNHGIDSGFSGP